MEAVKWILSISPLENKARKRALFISPNTTLKPVWIKNRAAPRRPPTHNPNKKGTPQRVPFEMVVQTGLEPLTSYKYPHGRADCGA